jgi:hypothetical protein
MADKYDIHFQLISDSAQVSGKLFSFGFKSAVGVRGPQKLINRWIKTLITPKGSDPFDRNVGTGFYGLLGSNITSRQDVIDAVSLFIEDCNNQIRASDRRNQSSDSERLQTATLASLIENDEDGFEIYVNIRNAAGITVTIPLPTT